MSLVRVADLRCKPFVSSSDEYLAIGAQLQVYLVLMCSILIQLTEESATSSGIVSALLITSFVMVVILGVILAVLEMVSEAQAGGYEVPQLWSRVMASVRGLSTGRRSVEIEMLSARSGPAEEQDHDAQQSASGGVRVTEIFDMDELQENDEVVHVQNPLNKKKAKRSSRKAHIVKEEQAQDESESQTIRRATVFSQVTAPQSNPKREMRRSSITPKANTPTMGASSRIPR